MKKMCSKCNQINEYSAETCTKCGCKLNESTAYKRCPGCGREFSLKDEECSDCRLTLIVCGTPSAMVFDENADKDGIPMWIWAVGIFLPVIGVIVAWIYSAVHKKNISHEGIVNLRLVCIFGQVVWLTALFVIIKLVFGFAVQ